MILVFVFVLFLTKYLIGLCRELAIYTLYVKSIQNRSAAQTYLTLSPISPLMLPCFNILESFHQHDQWKIGEV